ncbi:MAG: hypothetical protein KJO38_01060, partial [Gammaproteobacteria bacterium]|nr:hypothetical protein [Gammaproteobacteria bacterium]
MNDKYDDSFEDYPAGGNALKDVLTAADRELEPGTATDAAILAAARRSVGARPEALGWTVRHPLVRPLATAALLVLSVGVVTLLVEQDQTAPSLPRPAGPVDRMEPPAMDTARKAEDDGVGAVAPVLKAPAPMVFEHAAPPAMMDDDREKQDVDGHVDEAAAAAPVGSDAAFEALSDDAVPGPGKRDLRPERARRVDQAPTGAARQAEPESVPAFSRTLPAPAADSAPV